MRGRPINRGCWGSLSEGSAVLSFFRGRHPNLFLLSIRPFLRVIISLPSLPGVCLWTRAESNRRPNEYCTGTCSNKLKNLATIGVIEPAYSLSHPMRVCSRLLWSAALHFFVLFKGDFTSTVQGCSLVNRSFVTASLLTALCFLLLHDALLLVLRHNCLLF